jgi:hypothetical protein
METEGNSVKIRYEAGFGTSVSMDDFYLCFWNSPDIW